MTTCIDTFQSGNSRLFCELHVIVGRNEKNPLIVLLTGDGAKGLSSSTWPPLIEALSAAAFDVFGFDFQGLGRSEGHRSDLCVSVGTRNLEDAMGYLAKRGLLEKRRLGVIASSFGAAALFNSEAIKVFNAIALKSPVSNPMQTYEIEAGGTEELRKWREAKISAKSGVSFVAYDEATRMNLYANARQIAVPVLVVHGDADTIVPIAQSKRLVEEIGPTAKLVIIPGGEHDYKGLGAMKALIAEFTSFLAEALA